MKHGLITSIVFAVAVSGSSVAAAFLRPACDRLPASHEGNAPAPLWVVRAAMAPEREGVKIASIQLAGFEIGQVVLTDRPAMNAPEQVANWCNR